MAAVGTDPALFQGDAAFAVVRDRHLPDSTCIYFFQEATMARMKTYHVECRDDEQWQVKAEQNSRATSLHATKHSLERAPRPTQLSPPLLLPVSVLRAE